MIRGRWSLGSSLFGDAVELVWAVAEEAVLRRFWKHSTLGKLLQSNPFPRWVNMNDPVYADADSGTQSIDEQGNLWTETQVGLKLPNGEIVWPPSEYGGYPIATSKDRAALLEVFKKTAVELCFEVDSFVQNYSWVTRQLTVIADKESLREISIADPSAFGESRNNDDCQADHSGGIHEGAMGSST